MTIKDQITNLRAEGLSYGEIGKKLSRSRQSIHQIFTGYHPPQPKGSRQQVCEYCKDTIILGAEHKVFCESINAGRSITIDTGCYLLLREKGLI